MLEDTTCILDGQDEDRREQSSFIHSIIHSFKNESPPCTDTGKVKWVRSRYCFQSVLNRLIATICLQHVKWLNAVIMDCVRFQGAHFCLQSIKNDSLENLTWVFEYWHESTGLRRMHVPGKGKRMSKGTEFRVSMKGLRHYKMEIKFCHESKEGF